MRMIWFAIMASPMYYIFYPFIMGFGHTFRQWKERVGERYSIPIAILLVLQIAATVVLSPYILWGYLDAMRDLLVAPTTHIVVLLTNVSNFSAVLAFYVEAVNMNMIRVQDYVPMMKLLFPSTETVTGTDLMAVYLFDVHRLVLAESVQAKKRDIFDCSWKDKEGNHIEMGLHVFFGCY